MKEVFYIRFFIAYAAVFIFSAIPLLEAYIVIPLGIVSGLNIVLTMVIGLLGNILTVFLLAYYMDIFLKWRDRRKAGREQKESKKNKRAERIFNKYGVPGLAFLGPMFIGSHFTTLFIITLGGRRREAFIWVSLSVIVWTILFSLLFYYGVDLLGFESHHFIRKYLEVK